MKIKMKIRKGATVRLAFHKDVTAVKPEMDSLVYSSLYLQELRKEKELKKRCA